LYRQCHHPRPAKGRRQNQILKSILEPFLRDPQLTHTTTTETPSHVDPSPNFRQNWTLRAKYLDRYKGRQQVQLLPLLRVARTSKAMVDGATKIRVHALLLSAIEGGGGGEEG